MPTVVIKQEADKRLQSGHLWVYANEVAGPLKSFTPGEWVDIQSVKGHSVGSGYVNPHSLIAVRLCSRERIPVSPEFFFERIEKAVDRRKAILEDGSVGRMVYGESDGLPGLVIDRYGTHAVLQILTAGMEKHTEWILAAVDRIFAPESVILRNDATSRKLEGLKTSSRVVRGSSQVQVTIEGMRYDLDLLEGQKTGFFLDQRLNHRLTKGRVGGKSVLDMFSYIGAWSLHAAFHGARSVRGIDSSDAAIHACIRHAALNDLPVCRFEKADAFDALKSINEGREMFDVVILDPPAFAKSRSEARDAIRGYREINRRAAKALHDGGLLITCSCSHVVDADSFRNTVLQAVTSAGRTAWLVEQHTQSPDHPILLAMRETEYLKCLVLRVYR